MRVALILFLCTLNQGMVLAADSGADSLIETLGVQSGEKVDRSKGGQGIQLKDPYSIQLFSAWQNESKLSYELNAWVQKVLKGQNAAAAHLWTALQKDIPESFLPTARATWLYLLWKLDLPQTFLDAWLQENLNPKFGDSRVGMALDQTLAPGFDAWLEKNQPHLSPEQRKVIQRIPLNRGPHILSLQAYAAQRTGNLAAELLDRLPPGHRFKVALAQTVMLAKARAGDLRGAAAVMKRHLEPGIEAAGDPVALGNHYLQVARLLYQAGALDGAEQFYGRIPSGSPDYLKAREELMWVWLRKGDLTRLRGEMASFQSGLFDDKFAPDTYVVRAISNLKLCYYDKVQKDLTEFVEHNREWAKVIDTALKNDTPAAAEPKDGFTRQAEGAVRTVDAELAKLAKLGEESIGASLPAVGPQKHWESAGTRLRGTRELALKQQAAEYRRQWKNRANILKEAIHKMRFVKVEFLSQVREMAQNAAANQGKDASAGAKEAVDEKVAEKTSATLKTDDSEIAFPFDGVVWPDEVFRIRSLAEAQCLKGLKP